MIVPETILGEIFAQIPPIAYTDVNHGASTIEVKYHWGGQDDMNLYMEREAGNKTPLIWLVPNKYEVKAGEATVPIKLIIAKDSENKTAMNPKVWEDEFETVLDPLLENVIKSLERSGKTQILGNSHSAYREANYSEYERDSTGSKTKNKTIDHWNVIVLELTLLILNDAYCVKDNINFY